MKQPYYTSQAQPQVAVLPVGEHESCAHNQAELADLLPDWCCHGAVAVLRAFFDESGIHAGSPVTAVCGLIGSRNQWRAVARKWRKAMGERVFNYKAMRMEGALLNRLSTILANSDLEVVGAGFVGDWDRAADWLKRFPSCYHMIFEMMAQRMGHISAENWRGEPISVTFSLQDEYAKRVEEIWRTYNGNGLLAHIVNFGFGAPEDFAELQAADMIAYETFQCLREGAAGGIQPMRRRLLRSEGLSGKGLSWAWWPVPFYGSTL